MGGLAHGGYSRGNRLDGEMGYRLPVGSRLVGTPRGRFTTSEYGRDYRVGYNVSPMMGEALTVEVGIDTQVRQNPRAGNTDKGLLGRARISW